MKRYPISRRSFIALSAISLSVPSTVLVSQPVRKPVQNNAVFDPVEIGRTDKNEPIYVKPGKFSFKDYTNQKHVFEGKASDLNGAVIYSSMFYHEHLDVDVFPSDVRDLMLVFVNVDNVRLPADTIYVLTTQNMTPWAQEIADRQAGKLMNQPVMVISDRMPKRILVQNDLRDWELDVNDQPVKLVNEKAEKMAGRSIDPTDIPATKIASIDDLPTTKGFEAIYKETEPAPTLDEKAILEAIAAKSGIAATSAELIQQIDDEMNRMAAMKLKLEAGK